MLNGYYFRFDDDNKIKYGNLTNITEEMGKVMAYRPIYCIKYSWQQNIPDKGLHIANKDMVCQQVNTTIELNFII